MSFIRIIITFNAVLTSYCQNIEDLWLIGPEIIFLACTCGVKIAWQFSKFSNAISRKFWKTHIAAFCSQVHNYCPNVHVWQVTSALLLPNHTHSKTISKSAQNTQFVDSAVVDSEHSSHEYVPPSLLSRRSRQWERLSASELSIGLSVCLSVC